MLPRAIAVISKYFHSLQPRLCVRASFIRASVLCRFYCCRTQSWREGGDSIHENLESRLAITPPPRSPPRVVKRVSAPLDGRCPQVAAGGRKFPA